MSQLDVDEVDAGYADLTRPTELPQSWLQTNLGNVVDYGKVEKAEPNNISDDTWVLELEDIEKDSSKITQRLNFLARQSKSTKNRFKKGDVLYGKLRPYLNKVIVADSDGVCTTEIIPLSGGKNLNNQYLFFWLKHPIFLAYVSEVSYGVNMPRLGTKDGIVAPFVLAPFAEQQQIAAKLDELLAQVDTLKTRLDTIPKILKHFRQSVLAAAVSGRLTENWREENNPLCTDTKNITEKLFDNGITAGNFGKKSDKAPAIQEDEIRLVRQNECNWPMVRIGAICGCIVPNRDKPKTFSGDYHWLLTPHFEGQSIRIDYTKIENGLSEDEVAEYRAKVIAENSVVMTCVGRVGLSAVLSQKAVINQQLHAFIPNEYIIADFLAYMIRANVKYYENKATSTTVSYLNKTACNSLPIPLPSIEEQTEVVNRIEQLFTYADQIEQRVKDAQAHVNHLTQAILAKAFRGELTADWREQNPDLISGENSAEALLEKIRAESEATAATKKIGRKAKA
jgi:type I restriction enzyme S subunit